MTYRHGQTVQVKPDRPNGWKKKDWAIYAGTPVTISQIFEKIEGPKVYLVMMEEGPLKGESRWFKETELTTS